MTNITPFPRRPRIALLGEFSAGKSTVANALLCHARSPVRVTATHVPPIWYQHGHGAPVAVARDGSETPLDDGDLTQLAASETRVVKVPSGAELLQSLDLLDMPGSSDPNMDPDIWNALMPEVDGVLWCSPATQAWRQSEAAIWSDMPEALRARSLLLLTRMDKAGSAENRARVLARVRRETEGLFHGIHPVALSEPFGDPPRPDIFQASGLVPVIAALLDICSALRGEAPTPKPAPAHAAPAPAPTQEPRVLPRRVTANRARRPTGDALI